MTRNGYALLLSSVITSGMGIGYWVLAARLYDEEALGRGAALVSALLLVASLATAGLKRGLIRFVPSSGRSAGRLVRRVYGAGLAISLLYGIAFLAWYRHRTAGLTMLAHGWLPLVAFLAGTAAWGLFVLQDAVLIGVRRATLVPLTNAAFSVAKIGFLVLGVWLLSDDWGVFASWVVPAAATAVVVNVWLFRTGLRRLADDDDTRPPTLGQVVRFNGAEYLAALAWMAANYLMPLIIVARAGAEANAHFYLAAQISYGLFLVSSNITDALVAEGAKAQHGLAAKVRRASLQTAVVLVPGIVVAVTATGLIMSLFGSGYTGEAATTLRLLALAAAPNAVSTVVIAVAHVRQRMWLVVLLQVLMSSLSLGLGWAVLGGHGITGVAAAWLVAQTVTAVVAVAITIQVEPALRSGARDALIGWASRRRAVLARRRAERELAARVAALPEGVVPPGPTRLLGFQHDLLVAMVGQGDERAILRLAAGRQGRRGIAAHRSQLRALHDSAQLAAVRDLIPRTIRSDESANWLLETALAGTPASALAAGAERDAAVGAGLSGLDRLHSATARQLVVDDALVDLWVHEPIATVAEVVRSPGAARGLAALHRRLAAELAGRPVTVARLHGDPSLDNLLFSPDGAELTGIVDWEASAVGLPECDVMILLLARRASAGGEMGDQILDLLDNGWSDEERALLGTSWSVNAHLRPTTLVLLTWLGHVTANLEKTERYRANRWWVRHNVERVLEALAGAGRAAEALAPDAEPEPASIAPTPAPAAGGAPAVPDAVARPRLDTATIRFLVVATAVASWSAYLLDGPSWLRIPLVLGATLVAPAVVIGRCLGTPGPLIRGVIGSAGAVGLSVCGAEVLLYAHLWSPGLWLVLVSGTACALTGRIPPFQPTRPTPATPADVIVRRARADRVAR
jgi:O-antigen/teichoic acid export membrane protein/aminoglycoside phosphotransferase (APT) family kinase protein